jgi:5-methylthioadenosine/S-adenosylhomocysteine deaminase
MWLTETTLLDGAQGFRRADIEIGEGRICSLVAPGRRRSGAVDGSRLVVIPGLCDGHYHGGSSLLAGLEAGMQIHDWADRSAQGRVQAQLFEWLDGTASRAELEIVYRKEYLDLLCQGVTFVADSGLSDQADGLAEDVMTGLGLRGNVESYGSFDVPGDPHRVGHSLHFPEEEDLDQASLAATAAAATAAAATAAAGPAPVRLTGHCLETPLRRSLVEARFGQSTVAVLDAAGLLTPETVLFHGCLMDAQDIAQVAAAGASIVTCPVSNLLTGGRVPPVRSWIESGVTVALGTDWADTNFWEVVRATRGILAAQGMRTPQTAARLLGMATAGGAASYGRGDLGSIAEGQLADLVFLDAPALQPYLQAGAVSTLAAAVIQKGSAATVRHVMVGGEWAVFDRAPTRCDLQAANQAYAELAERLAESITVARQDR